MGCSTERPEFALCELGAFPLVVACEIDVLPAEPPQLAQGDCEAVLASPIQILNE
jgi:hypothetical protein